MTTVRAVIAGMWSRIWGWVRRGIWSGVRRGMRSWKVCWVWSRYRSREGRRERRGEMSRRGSGNRCRKRRGEGRREHRWSLGWIVSWCRCGGGGGKGGGNRSGVASRRRRGCRRRKNMVVRQLYQIRGFGERSRGSFLTNKRHFSFESGEEHSLF